MKRGKEKHSRQKEKQVQRKLGGQKKKFGALGKLNSSAQGGRGGAREGVPSHSAATGDLG